MGVYKKHKLAKFVQEELYKVEGLDPRILLSGDPVVGRTAVVLFNDVPPC